MKMVSNVRLFLKQLECSSVYFAESESVHTFPAYVSLHFLVYLGEYILIVCGKSNFARCGNLKKPLE